MVAVNFEESRRRYQLAWDILWLLADDDKRLYESLVKLHHATMELVVVEVGRALDEAGVDDLQDELLLLDILSARS